eukprot:TRINITY_DN3580_c0_g1_i1.p1 TRINITY_DN3580_c0_g1~~TRINITY_DN3580_c0_g1_i1.p1  ORF type:complete len:340 (+),score=57.37 TRINITY_DN3580_c0_g1_i1:43-1020(+)
MAWTNVRRGSMRLGAVLHSIGQEVKSLAQPGKDIAPFGSRMASNQVVRNRMRSVKSIQKITKAMKMVAASKLRAVQVKVEGSRGIPEPFVAMLGDSPVVGNDASKHVIVAITSDRGLCGGINSTSVKFSKAVFNIATGAGKEAKYVIIGEKGRAQLSRDSRKKIAVTISETQKLELSFTQVSMMADELLKSLEFDVMSLVFNKFRSVVTFQPTVATVLSPEVMARESEGGSLAYLDNYEIEGAETKAEVLQNLSEFGFTAQLFNGLLENTASEMGARMSAMDSSSRNASEMLDRLTLSYNRSRQAQITTELIEIISGAAALEAGD